MCIVSYSENETLAGRPESDSNWNIMPSDNVLRVSFTFVMWNMPLSNTEHSYKLLKHKLLHTKAIGLVFAKRIMIVSLHWPSDFAALQALLSVEW